MTWLRMLCKKIWEKTRVWKEEQTWQWILFKCFVVCLVIFAVLWCLRGLLQWKAIHAGVHVQELPAVLKSLVELGAGIATIAAFFLAWRQGTSAETSQLRDRYTKAIEKLGASTVEGKLAAIESLEQIAGDSPKYHGKIVESLSDYIRRNAPSPTEENPREEFIHGPASEIQTILKILGRTGWEARKKGKGHELNLSGADLRKADFTKAHLEGAGFIGAHLEGATFCAAHAEGAYFNGAHVQAAEFHGAHLERANFNYAHLENASFFHAHVEGASFERARLHGAEFNSANLTDARFSELGRDGKPLLLSRAYLAEAEFTGAEGLNVKQIKEGEGWEQAKYDEAFARELGL